MNSLSTTALSLTWQAIPFSELSTPDLLDIICLRQRVFVVEQQCIYDEADVYDRISLHLVAFDSNDSCDSNQSCNDKKNMVAYARILPPNTKHSMPSIGRILVAAPHRGMGFGHDLVRRCISACRSAYPGEGIFISAQLQLKSFYAAHGFTAISPTYDDAGIEHIDMVLNAALTS